MFVFVGYCALNNTNEHLDTSVLNIRVCRGGEGLGSDWNQLTLQRVYINESASLYEQLHAYRCLLLFNKYWVDQVEKSLRVQSVDFKSVCGVDFLW